MCDNRLNIASKWVLATADVFIYSNSTLICKCTTSQVSFSIKPTRKKSCHTWNNHMAFALHHLISVWRFLHLNILLIRSFFSEWISSWQRIFLLIFSCWEHPVIYLTFFLPIFFYRVTNKYTQTTNQHTVAAK